MHIRLSTILILTLGLVISLSLGSCSSTPSPSGPHSEPITDFCKTVTGSSNSVLTQDGIADLISSICNRVSSIQLYRGSGEAKIIDLGSKMIDSEYFVHFIGGIELDTVPASVYYNMVKDQARGELESKLGDKFKYDSSVTYTINKKSSSTVEYTYEKDETDSTLVDYDGMAQFVSLEDSELYVIANKLTQAKDVTNMYSVSIIVSSNNGEGTRVYMSLTQTSNSHGQSNAIEKSQKFFKQDAKYTYENAMNYNKL